MAAMAAAAWGGGKRRRAREENSPPGGGWGARRAEGAGNSEAGAEVAEAEAEAAKLARVWTETPVAAGDHQWDEGGWARAGRMLKRRAPAFGGGVAGGGGAKRARVGAGRGAPQPEALPHRNLFLRQMHIERSRRAGAVDAAAAARAPAASFSSSSNPFFAREHDPPDEVADMQQGWGRATPPASPRPGHADEEGEAADVVMNRPREPPNSPTAAKRPRRAAFSWSATSQPFVNDTL